MLCSKCNREIPDDSVFCAYCGERQQKEESSDEACALFDTAENYRLGEGVEKDIKMAETYYQKSLEAGEDYALLALAELYFIHWEELGEDESIRGKAFNLFLEFLKKGYEEDVAHFDLGRCYFFGVGTEVNYPLAEKEFKKAMEMNSEDLFYKSMYADCLREQRRKECVAIYEELYATDEYFLDAGHELYILYLNDCGRDFVEKNEERAIQIMRSIESFCDANEDSLSDFDKEICYVSVNRLAILLAEKERDERIEKLEQEKQMLLQRQQEQQQQQQQKEMIRDQYENAFQLLGDEQAGAARRMFVELNQQTGYWIAPIGITLSEVMMCNVSNSGRLANSFSNVCASIKGGLMSSASDQIPIPRSRLCLRLAICIAKASFALNEVLSDEFERILRSSNERRFIGRFCKQTMDPCLEKISRALFDLGDQLLEVDPYSAGMLYNAGVVNYSVVANASRCSTFERMRHKSILREYQSKAKKYYKDKK